VNVISIHYLRLAKQKAAFLGGADAKKLQMIATLQWQHIRNTMRKNVSGFEF
jgi:hypothetical protein